jgi:hypothetical protein
MADRTPRHEDQRILFRRLVRDRAREFCASSPWDAAPTLDESALELDDALAILIGDIGLDKGGWLRMSAGSFRRELKRFSAWLGKVLPSRPSHDLDFSTLAAVAQGLAPITARLDAAVTSITENDERTLLEAFPDVGQALIRLCRETRGRGAIRR